MEREHQEAKIPGLKTLRLQSPQNFPHASHSMTENWYRRRKQQLFQRSHHQKLKFALLQNNHHHDLTSNWPARVRGRKPLYGRFGKFLRSSLSICRPDSAMPIILKPTWNVGKTWRCSNPVSRTRVPDNDGALSFGILPIDHMHDCGNRPVAICLTSKHRGSTI